MNLHSISFRIVIFISVVAIVTIGVLLGAYVVREKANAIENEVHASRNLILMAESVRQQMADKWRLGLFTPEIVRNLPYSSAEERKEKILATIPVVTAWESAKAKAKEGGFEFRTPRHNARNPNNEPDAIEAEVLAYFQANPKVSEHYVIDQQRNSIRYFRPVRLGEVCMYCHGDPASSSEHWQRDDGKDITGFAMDNKKVGDLHGAFEIVRPLTDADARMHTSLITASLIGIVMIVLAIFFLSWWINRFVGIPVRQAVEGVKRAQKDRDLAYRMDIKGRHELAQLGEAFNGFVSQVRDVLQDVSVSAQTVAGSSQQVAEISINTNQSIHLQQTEIDQVASAINQMSTTVQDVARIAAEAATATDEASQEAKQGSTVVSQTIHAIERLASEVEAAAKVIEQLNENSEKIGSVVAVISDIAEQTNLLALNAAIEAARAGESGRGFAVVADEVRSLANRTQESTMEIRQMIEALQSGVGQAVAVMNQGRERASESVAQAGHAGESLSSINRATQTLQGINQQIATAAEEQSAVAEEVNRNIGNISRLTTATAEDANRSAAESEELASLSQELQKSIDRFKL